MAYADELERSGGEIVRELTEADIHGRDKYALMVEYKQDEDAISAKFVGDFGGTRVVGAHRNTVALMGYCVDGTFCHRMAAEAMVLAERESMTAAAYQPKGETRARPSRPLRTTSAAERAARALVAFNALGFAGLEGGALGTVVTRSVVEKALEDHSSAIELLYKARGRVWPDIRRGVPPKTTKGHLSAINAILTEQYGVKVVASDGRRRAFMIQPANRPEWPDTPVPIPVDDGSQPPREREQVVVQDSYEAELLDIVAEFLSAMDAAAAPRTVV
jgi:hypothetical protein